MEFLVVWFICGIICAMIGRRKGEVISGFIIGMILGPLGIVIALISKGNRKTCQFCREMIHKEASVCPKCQRDQPAIAPRGTFMSELRRSRDS